MAPEGALNLSLRHLLDINDSKRFVLCVTLLRSGRFCQKANPVNTPARFSMTCWLLVLGSVVDSVSDPLQKLMKTAWLFLKRELGVSPLGVFWAEFCYFHICSGMLFFVLSLIYQKVNRTRVDVRHFERPKGLAPETYRRRGRVRWA